MSKIAAHRKIREVPRSSEGETDPLLGRRVERLIQFSRKLRLYSRGIACLLLYQFVLIVSGQLFGRSEPGEKRIIGLTDIDFIIVCTSLFVFVVSLTVLYYFNSLRKKGMLLYEEIVDDIEWSVKRREYIHRPSVQARAVLKDFLHASDLPFTSGVNGQAIYVLGFALLTIASLFLVMK